MVVIKDIRAYEILESKGFPTIACTLQLSNGMVLWASVPAGGSTGEREIPELRDGDPKRYDGRGVQKGVDYINHRISKALIGKSPDVIQLDAELLAYDQPEQPPGSNVTLVLSYLVLRAMAADQHLPVYLLIAEHMRCKPTIPRCMFNLVNGGVHAPGGGAFQEIMLVPRMVEPYASQLHCVVQLYHALVKKMLQSRHVVGYGDEGGIILPSPLHGLERQQEAISFLVTLARDVGCGQFDLALDVAASQLFDSQLMKYQIDQRLYSSHDLIDFYKHLIKEYFFCAIEDGLDQNDWEGWKGLTESIGSACLLVGDDLFVTDSSLIMRGACAGVANAVVIKPNQRGTVTQALEAVKAARNVGFPIVVSHRSAETSDDIIADFAVGVGADYFKSGSPVHSERLAKYNRLLIIERELTINKA